MPISTVQIAHPANTRLHGIIAVPSDKSISHRALILGALCVGKTKIQGLLESTDVLATAQALRAYGANIKRGADGLWRINGVGIGGLMPPDDVLDLGNSGTTARLMLGLAASHKLKSVFTGDESLRKRPMQRVITPLVKMGAKFDTSPHGRLPLTVKGRNNLMPITYTLPIASAQVKSAILLAGLNTPGKTTIIECSRTRDHTENLMRYFGAEVVAETLKDGSRQTTLNGRPELQPKTVSIPGDPSSAAFPIAAALLVPGSEIIIQNVGLNPLRTAFFDTLRDMGALIEESNRRYHQGELIANLKVRAGPLRGIEVPSERAPAMIDEYPILSALAAFADGRTVMRGIGELRVKESDRISAMVNGLNELGAHAEEIEDGMVVYGHSGPAPARKNNQIESRGDHRIAMSFLVYGLGAQDAVKVKDCDMIETSFPNFINLMNGLGGKIVAGS